MRDRQIKENKKRNPFHVRSPGIKPRSKQFPYQRVSPLMGHYSHIGNQAAQRLENPNGMAEPVITQMEHAFKTDFSDVTITPNSSKAPALGALAYTRGNEIHFAPGMYNPGTEAGQRLLGHELAHVVQQREGRVKTTVMLKGIVVNDDAALEKEADTKSELAIQMGSQGFQSKGVPDSGMLYSATNTTFTSSQSPVVQLGRKKGGGGKGQTGGAAASALDMETLELWEEGNLIKQPFDIIYQQLIDADPEVVKAYIKGRIKKELIAKMEEEMETVGFDTSNLGTIDQSTVEAGQGLIEKLEAVNQANKRKEKKEEGASADAGASASTKSLDELLVDITDYLVENRAQLEAIKIKEMSLVKYLQNVIGTAPDECNNVFATTVIPELRIALEGKPKVFLLLERLTDIGIKIKI